MFFALILISTIFTASSLSSMELVKKITKHKSHIPNNFYTTIQQFWLTQKIGKKNKIPIEITNHIQWHKALAPTNNIFERDFPYADVWHDFRIPILYYYLLTQDQRDTIEKLFTYDPSWVPYKDRVSIHYSLDSKQEYKQFLTIPREFRQYLTKLPLSEQNKLKSIPYSNPDENINEHKIIRVGTCKKGIKPKLIIPEEKLKNIKLDVNR